MMNNTDIIASCTISIATNVIFLILNFGYLRLDESFNKKMLIRVNITE
jgi:hypothetical protein